MPGRNFPIFHGNFPSLLAVDLPWGSREDTTYLGKNRSQVDITARPRLSSREVIRSKVTDNCTVNDADKQAIGTARCKKCILVHTCKVTYRVVNGSWRTWYNIAEQPRVLSVFCLPRITPPNTKSIRTRIPGVSYVLLVTRINIPVHDKMLLGTTAVIVRTTPCCFRTREVVLRSATPHFLFVRVVAWMRAVVLPYLSWGYVFDHTTTGSTGCTAKSHLSCVAHKTTKKKTSDVFP